MKRRSKSLIVTKRDGTLERFSLPKLVNSLMRPMRGCGEEPRLAYPLARAVALHLREYRGPRPPSTNYIFRCVCSVLEQTGLEDVGDALLAQRRNRTIWRRRIRVVESNNDSKGERWRKAAIVEMLSARFGLRHNVCRFIAGKVEMQLHALNYRLIRKSFLMELIQNEVLAWGLGDERALRHDAPVASKVTVPWPKSEN